MKRLLLAAGLAVVLAVLALSVNSGLLSGLDASVAEWFDARRTIARDREDSGIFGYIGKPIHVLVAAAVCGAALSAMARSVMPALCVVGGVGVGAAVEGTLKAVIGRTTTAGPVTDYYAHSFPSGHVTGAAALLGMVAVCLGAGRSRGVQALLAVLVVGAVLVVAYLALYTGAHTFTDVLGGMALGGAVVAAGSAVLAATSRASRA